MSGMEILHFIYYEYRIFDLRMSNSIDILESFILKIIVKGT